MEGGGKGKIFVKRKDKDIRSSKLGRYIRDREGQRDLKNRDTNRVRYGRKNTKMQSLKHVYGRGWWREMDEQIEGDF